MIILNGMNTVCIDVCTLQEVSFFLNDASQMMCNFVTMAKGEEMVFPVQFLMNKIGAMLSEYIEFDKYRYVMRVREAGTFNTFEMYVTVVPVDQNYNKEDFDTINIEKMVEQIKWTFSAVPKGNKKNGD